MRQAKLKQTQQGSALLTALFIMTLVAIVATAMSSRLQLDIYRTRLVITSDKLYLASQFVTFWAMDELSKNNLSFKGSRQKGLLKDFPIALQSATPDVSIKGSLYDLQALFNLNNLQDKKFHPQFDTLLQHLHSKTNASQRKSLISAINYWIGSFHPEGGQDTRLSFYLQQHPTYLPAYQFMQNPSELRIVQGVTGPLYESILPYITTLPEITPINLNTASKSILMTLGHGLAESDVEKLLKARGKKGLKHLSSITPLLEELNIPPNQVTLDSSYFMSIAETSSADLNLVTYTVFKRKKDNKGLVVVGIIRQSLNTI